LLVPKNEKEREIIEKYENAGFEVLELALHQNGQIKTITIKSKTGKNQKK
jgi:translation initiation factor RLI1